MNKKVPYDCTVAAEWMKRMRELDAAFVDSFFDGHFENKDELKELLDPVYKGAKKVHDELDRYIRERYKHVAEDRFLIAALQQTKEVPPIRA